MSTIALSKRDPSLLSAFDNFFKPWNEWFDGDMQWPSAFRPPAVNISQHEQEYQVSLAAPGLKKNDFKIDVEGNILTISCEKEESKDEKDKKFTRREYSYSSFSRSFTLPEEINVDKIEATYEDGLLKVSLPRKAEARKLSARHVTVK